MSSRKDGSWVKSQRLAELSKLIAKTMPKGCDYKKLLSQIQYKMGLTKNRAAEYIELVCTVHDWTIFENKITPTKET